MMKPSEPGRAVRVRAQAVQSTRSNGDPNGIKTKTNFGGSSRVSERGP
jgi:hypothetical protein